MKKIERKKKKRKRKKVQGKKKKVKGKINWRENKRTKIPLIFGHMTYTCYFQSKKLPAAIDLYQFAKKLKFKVHFVKN